MYFTGEAIKYGDDVSTDLIFPGRYTYMLLTEEQIGEHALEDLDTDFSKRDTSGCFIVAGKNWGCGSAREQAVKCLRQKGIRAVIASSIARIYYRNCINEGLMPIVCPEAVDAIENGDTISVDVDNGLIITDSGSYSFPKYPEFVRGILECGGLIASVRRELEVSNKSQEGEEANCVR